MCFLTRDQISDPHAIMFTIDKKVIKTRQKYYPNCDRNNPRNVKCYQNLKKIRRSRPDLKYVEAISKSAEVRDEISFYTDQSKWQFYFDTISICNIFYFKSMYYYYAINTN